MRIKQYNGSVLLKTYFGLIRSKFRAKVGQKCTFLSYNVNKAFVKNECSVKSAIKIDQQVFFFFLCDNNLKCRGLIVHYKTKHDNYDLHI